MIAMCMALQVLDEADKLLELGFLEQVDEILAACSGEGVVRASVVSVTERVLFFNHEPRAFHYQCSSSKTFFVIDRVARKSCVGRRYLRSMYSLISVREVRSVAPLADAPYRHLRRLEQRRGPEQRRAEEDQRRLLADGTREAAPGF